MIVPLLLDAVIGLVVLAIGFIAVVGVALLCLLGIVWRYTGPEE